MYKFYEIGSMIDSLPYQHLIAGAIEILNKRSNTKKILNAPAKINIIEDIIYTTITNCHCCYIDNDAYTKLSDQVFSNKMQESIDFFMTLPMFAKWNLTRLRAIVQQAEINTSKRHDIIYTMNNPSDWVYIVKTGEYEVYETCTEITKKEPILIALLGPTKARERIKRYIEQNTLKHKDIELDYTTKKTTILLNIEGKGQFLGEIEALEEKPYKYTVKCKSVIGELYKFPAEYFRTIIYNDIDSQNVIKELIRYKKKLLDSQKNKAKIFAHIRNESLKLNFENQNYRSRISISTIKNGRKESLTDRKSVV